MARVRFPDFKRYHVPLPRLVALERYLPFVPCAYCGYNTPVGLMRTDDFGKKFCWRHPMGDHDHSKRRG